MVLWEKDEQNVKQIGELLYLDSGTLTPVLKRMEKIGILCRKRSVDDDRVVVNKLTEKGQNLKETLLEIPSKLFLQSGLEMEEVHRLMTDLNRLLGKMSH
jgi:DNA-binding MarR family transcriptional regulator